MVKENLLIGGSYRIKYHNDCDNTSGNDDTLDAADVDASGDLKVASNTRVGISTGGIASQTRTTINTDNTLSLSSNEYIRVIAEQYDDHNQDAMAVSDEDYKDRTEIQSFRSLEWDREYTFSYKFRIHEAVGGYPEFLEDDVGYSLYSRCTRRQPTKLAPAHFDNTH